MKNAVIFCLAATLLCSPQGSYGAELLQQEEIPASVQDSYSDVRRTDWFYQPVLELSKCQIISGMPDGRFHPEDTVTYGEFITMAVKMKENEVGNANQKGNAEMQQDGHWARRYYDQALEALYFTKEDIPPELLDMPIPRSSMALISARSLPETETVRGSQFDQIADAIWDVSADNPYQYEIVQSFGAGILSGYGDGSFRPDQTLSRGEAASVIWRLGYPVRRHLPNMEELELRSHGRNLSLEQQERIRAWQANENPPISFHWDTDVNRDGTMREEKAREYLDQLLSSLRFYGREGKYYMTVDFPQVPEGFRVSFGADVYYKPRLMKSPWAATTNWTMMEKDKIPSQGTVTREITGMKSLEQVYTASAGFSINRIDETDDGSCSIRYVLQKDVDGSGTYDSFGISRYGTGKGNTEIEYDLGRHFTWE